MSKKKSNPKKHKFKHVESAPAEPSVGSTSPAAPKSVSSRAVAATASTRDFSYVATDVRRIGFMVGGLIVVELAFYYALVFTPVGAAVYRLVNV
jgi:hypothetical protein